MLSGCKSQLLKHVVSHGRQVYMILNNRNTELNLRFYVKVDDYDYVIFATSSVMKCFGCGEEGHTVSACPGRGDSAPPGPDVTSASAPGPAAAGPVVVEQRAAAVAEGGVSPAAVSAGAAAVAVGGSPPEAAAAADSAAVPGQPAVAVSDGACGGVAQGVGDGKDVHEREVVVLCRGEENQVGGEKEKKKTEIIEKMVETGEVCQTQEENMVKTGEERKTWGEQVEIAEMEDEEVATAI
ncbi:hypothetical protein PBY51_004676 [Eleginops maclovinus]|uniref:CCHC-type domain-containing protein n=1 Tax=Eleginops maclovinus TaxID=56733 RepID=A0AAN8AGT9_ELEMC|nr:hypothetical protein PBY51_004676 [Eleginops maclovinus]